MDIQTETMKRAFLGWQCRLRQIAVREEDGRPTPGMRPQFDFSEDGQFANAITVLIVRVDAFADASQFRHLVLRSQDPAERLAQPIELPPEDQPLVAVLQLLNLAVLYSPRQHFRHTIRQECYRITYKNCSN